MPAEYDIGGTKEDGDCTLELGSQAGRKPAVVKCIVTTSNFTTGSKIILLGMTNPAAGGPDYILDFVVRA